MSDALKARLEEARRKAAAAKAAEAMGPVPEAAPAASSIGTALPPMRSPPSAPKEAPPSFEMINPSTVLVPTPGATLDYRGDPSETHRTSFSLVKAFLAGNKRGRDDAPLAGTVRLGPAANAVMVDIESTYAPEGTLGEGAYGTVTEARVIGTASSTPQGTMRAVKEVKEGIAKESLVGYPPFLLREFDAVMRLQHPNILHGVELGKSSHSHSVFLITEHGGINLKDFLFSPRAYMHLSSRNTNPSAPAAVLAKVKCVAKQLLTGLAFLHDHCMLHRDLKTANILIDKTGTLRICDFGLARYYREGDVLTGGVVTLMYRAPEVHFGIPDYSSKIDMWSAGCVIAELLLKAPLFPADKELDHFRKLCEVLGVPDDVVAFPGMLTLKTALTLMQSVKGTVNPNGGNRLRELFAKHPWYRGAKECVDDDFIDLLTSLLKWNPKDRPNAHEALRHRWFASEPLPCEPAELMKPLPSGPEIGPNASVSQIGVGQAAPASDDAADEAEACAGKQDLEVKSIGHDQKRHLLNQGGDLAQVQAEDEGTTPPPADVE